MAHLSHVTLKQACLRYCACYRGIAPITSMVLKVLEGLTNVLDGVRSIWIETTPDADASGENNRIHQFLTRYGFRRDALEAPVRGENSLYVKH